MAENIALGDQRDRGLMLDREALEASVEVLAEYFGLAVDPRAQHLAALGRRAAARRDPQGAVPRRARPDPRRAHRGAHAAGGPRALRHAARDGGRRPRDRLHLAQAARGARGLRPHHRAARRACRRDGRERGGHATCPRRADGRPRGRDRPQATEPRAGREVVLEAHDLHAEGDRGLPALRGVSLAVRGGEIVGIAGVAGNGQRELAETLTGMRAATSGRVSVSGGICARAIPAMRSRTASHTCPRTGSAPESRRASRSRRTPCSRPIATRD